MYRNWYTMEAYGPVWPGLACREWDASPSPFSSRRWLAEIVRTRGARESPWAVVMRNIPPNQVMASLSTVRPPMRARRSGQ